MNQKQRIIIWIGMLAVIVAAAYLPWNYTTSRQDAAAAIKDAGYHLISRAPPPEHEYQHYGVAVDWGRVLLELAAVAVVTGGLYVTLSDAKDTSASRSF
jgi:hypothetical protein